jgi:hypothetical protein
MGRIEGAVEDKRKTSANEQNCAETGEDEGFHNGKIYCANCIHCKVIPASSNKTGQYVLRVRCAAGKWKKKLGKEKLYRYCTITRRYLDSCASYEEMGDTRDFIKNLKKTLSGKDEVFTLAAELD